MNFFLPLGNQNAPAVQQLCQRCLLHGLPDRRSKRRVCLHAGVVPLLLSCNALQELLHPLR
jgi:hypothetical protein